jgi:hypothetical protein
MSLPPAFRAAFFLPGGNMKYPIPDSEDVEWQQDMLREIDRTLETIIDDFELESRVEKYLTGVIARVASLRAYSGY